MKKKNILKDEDFKGMDRMEPINDNENMMMWLKKIVIKIRSMLNGLKI